MQVELGNPAPHEYIDDTGVTLPGPAVTYVTVPDDYGAEPADTRDLALALARSAGGVTRLPGQEAFLAIAGPAGCWANHGKEPPTWVWSDNPVLQKLLADFWGIPEGRPDDIEDTHFTYSGPPGVGPQEA